MEYYGRVVYLKTSDLRNIFQKTRKMALELEYIPKTVMYTETGGSYNVSVFTNYLTEEINMMEFIEAKIVPVIAKITDHKYFQALRRGFMTIMPLTIIGSLFMLITDFPLNGYADFMAGIFGADWMSFIEPAYRATFNMLGFLLVGTMAYKLAEDYELDSLSVMILSFVAYVVVTPKFVMSSSGEIVGRVLSFTWLGTKGVITAIFVSIFTVEIFRFCVKKNLVIKMPDSVPDMVARSFSALLPGIVITTVMLIINGVCTVCCGSFHELIYSIVQVPLQGLTSSAFAITVVAGLNGLLWWFGIHPTVVNSIVNPLLIANSDANQALLNMGNLSVETGNIGTIQMIDQFATIGGAGMTIGLLISMFIVGRSVRLKSMTKISMVPAIFNIDEPLVFGLPIVFNPLMIIPVTLAPIVSVLVAYISMKIGFLDLFGNIMLPWTTPALFSGFLVGGGAGLLVQALAIAAATMVYLPFVKALDKQYRREERDENKEQGARKAA